MRLIAILLIVAGLRVAWAEPNHPNWPPDSYSVYYGELDQEALAKLARFDLVIVHPGDDRENLSRQKVTQLKANPIVIGYVSIGEDPEVPAGPPQPGQQLSGPSFFLKSNGWKEGHNNYPSRYLDQKRYRFSQDGFLQFDIDGKPMVEDGQDGIPDENGVWGSYYVRADDPQWHQIVFSKLDYLQELGVDGFFLDTVDTASPWGSYGYTAEGMVDLVKAIRERYPDHFILANRGLFLLEGRSDYGQAIDGLMFESFLTHWNYAAGRGERSPWLRWHVQALDDTVAKASQGNFHLFFLDYLDPDQEDLDLLLADQRDLLDQVPEASVAFSEPSLRTIYDDFLPAAVKPPDARLSEVKFRSLPGGRYEVIAQIEGGELSDQLQFDFRISTRALSDTRWPQLDQALIRLKNQDGNRYVFEGWGLNKAATYHTYARLVSLDGASNTVRDTVSTPLDHLPAQVEAPAVRALDSSALISWQADSLVANRYRITVMSDPWTVLSSLDVTGSSAHVQGLQNGQEYLLTVSAVTADNRVGAPSLPLHVISADCTPPAPPSGLKVTAQNQRLAVRWEKNGAATYKVYIVPEEKPLRIPLRTQSSQAETPVAPGRYRVFVTAVDGSGNESRPAEQVRVEVN